MSSIRNRVQKMTHYALFIALILLLGISPIGFLVLPFGSLAFVQIPVTIGGFAFGWRGGAVFGIAYGLVNIFRSLMTPDAVAATILSISRYNILIIFFLLFVPRFFSGIFSALAYAAVPKNGKHNFLASCGGGLMGSVANTIFVIAGLYVWMTFTATGQLQAATLQVLIGTVGLMGIIEAAGAAILCGLTGRALSPVLNRLSAL